MQGQNSTEPTMHMIIIIKEKKTNVNIQKIECINSNINVNGIDITRIPQDQTTFGTRRKEEAKINKGVVF